MPLDFAAHGIQRGFFLVRLAIEHRHPNARRHPLRSILRQATRWPLPWIVAVRGHPMVIIRSCAGPLPGRGAIELSIYPGNLDETLPSRVG